MRSSWTTRPTRRRCWRRSGSTVLFKGDDWRNTPKGDQLEASMSAAGVEVHYFPYTKTTSSTLLRQRINE